MEKIWYCQFKKLPKKITVGQNMILSCDGLQEVNFKKKIWIEFLDTRHNHSLKILNNISEDGSLILRVSSYRTGQFKHPFYITDGEQSVRVNNLSFHVESVLTPVDNQPHGPFDPISFSSDWVISYWFFGIFLVICSSVFVYRFIKRTCFVKRVLKRKTYAKPSKSFILDLRKEHNHIKSAFKDLELSFKTFLENHLLIPVQNQRTKKIIKNLKRYQPVVYKNSGSQIKQILNEFSQLDEHSFNDKNYLKLKKACQNSVFSFEDKKT